MELPEVESAKPGENEVLVKAEGEAVLAMVDAYSRDPMGNGKRLDADGFARSSPR